MAKPKKQENNEKALPVFAKMNATSLMGFSAFTIVLVSLLFYGVGFNAAVDNNTDIAPENLKGLANYQPVEKSFCVVYSDEVLISEINCSIPADCTPNGICYEPTGTCAYFIN